MLGGEGPDKRRGTGRKSRGRSRRGSKLRERGQSRRICRGQTGLRLDRWWWHRSGNSRGNSILKGRRRRRNPRLNLRSWRRRKTPLRSSGHHGGLVRRVGGSRRGGLDWNLGLNLGGLAVALAPVCHLGVSSGDSAHLGGPEAIPRPSIIVLGKTWFGIPGAKLLLHRLLAFPRIGSRWICPTLGISWLVLPVRCSGGRPRGGSVRGILFGSVDEIPRG